MKIKKIGAKIVKDSRGSGVICVIVKTAKGDFVTSAPAGTKYGDPLAGNYIQGGLKRWFDSHPELKNGTTLIISVIEPKKRYSLKIKE